MTDDNELQGNVTDDTKLSSAGFQFPEITIDPIDDEDFNLLGKEGGDDLDELLEGKSKEKVDSPTYGKDADQTAIATYETWLEKGLIPESKDFDGTFEQLEKLTESIPTIVQNALIERTPKQGKDIVNYILTKGEDLKVEELTQFLKLEEQAANLDSTADFTEIEEARNFLFDKYTKLTNLEETAIDAMLDKLEEKGTDQVLSKANELLSKDKEEIKAAKDKEIETASTTKQQRADAIKAFNDEIVTTLNDLNWSKDKVETIQKEYNTGITQKKFDAVLNDAKNLPQLINFFTHYDLDKKTFDFTGFAKAAATKDVKDIKKTMFADKFKSSIHTTKSRNTPAETEFNLDDYIIG